jgi:hypothetical protein
MRKALAVFGTGTSFTILCTSVSAQQLPKSGSISFHTGWKDTSVAIQVADKRWQGQGMVTGATFNDKGTGPVHLGPANCSYTFFAVEGNVKNMGFCAFGDGDGDRIFSQFTGTGKPDGEAGGTNEITGGTGMYAGIQGSGPWKCKGVGQTASINACSGSITVRPDGPNPWCCLQLYREANS